MMTRLVAWLRVRMNLGFTKYTHARQEKKGKAERFDHRNGPARNRFGRGFVGPWLLASIVGWAAR